MVSFKSDCQEDTMEPSQKHMVGEGSRPCFSGEDDHAISLAVWPAAFNGSWVLSSLVSENGLIPCKSFEENS